jgi:SAM-dependent methyltransferase
MPAVLGRQLTDPEKKQFLHVGCGSARKTDVSPGFIDDDWIEVRLDINPGVNPDIVASMLDMQPVLSGSFDALYSAHNVEHLFFHEIPNALKEFRRVLKDDGFAVITCPDAQSICAQVAEGRLTEAVYTSPSGPISPIDILWGHRPSLAAGNYWMAHKCGLTEGVLASILQECGFASVATIRRPAPYYDLWALAGCAKLDDKVLDDLIAAHFPTPPLDR